MDFRQMIAQRVWQAAQDAYGESALSAADYEALLELPPDPAMGDYALPCFKLAKSLRKPPVAIAEALAERVPAEGFERVEAVKGYLNFYLDRAGYARTVVEAVLAANGRYGASDVGRGKTALVEYSSINIAKRFHIGHLSTTMLGNALYRMYQYAGYNCVAINHLGDWGTQFGKMIAAYKRWGDREQVEAGGIEELTKLYVRFDQEAQKDSALVDEGRAWFKKIEDSDPEALEIFNWFKELTLRDTAKVYDLLGVHFDSYAGESFYNDKMDRVINELKAKNLLTISEGASIVDLEPYGMPPCLILKKDGATLYATRDIAAALYRHDTYHFDKCLYVVVFQQDLHFRQWFKVLELMGYDWAKDCVHVAFGMISYEGQSLSTRKGYVVYLEDLLEQAQQKALAIIEEKSPNLPNKAEVARQVGIGAVVYADLSNNRIKDIDFSWERALNFDGETGPYVQYTHARCCSVLRKAAEMSLPDPDWNALTDDEAQDCLRKLGRFPDVIQEAADKYEPSMITRAVTDLAQAYNKFYYEHRILDDDPAAAAARVALTRAMKNVIKTGLYLIGIEAPERM